MVRQGFSLVLITSLFGFFTIFSIFNYPPIFSYEVTDQNNEGVFSSLSRNFDKTLEDINSDDKSLGVNDKDSSASTANSDDESDDKDSSASTANSDDESLKNSTIASNSPNSNIELSNSTEVADFESIDLESLIN